MCKRLLVLFFAGFLFFAGAESVLAARMYVVSEGSELGIGSTFEVAVRIDSPDDEINAAQGTLTFSSRILEAVSVDIDSSKFNFWVEEPGVEEPGRINFTGGTANGVAKEGIPVFIVTMRAVGAGKTNVTLSDAVVTASDGQGTNVLDEIEGAAVEVSTRVVGPVPEEVVEEEVIEVVIPEPEIVTREAVIAEDLPALPILSIPAYPENGGWSNKLGEVTVLWEVPDDITKTAVAFDQLPNTEPPNADGQLATGKKLGEIPGEGVWYVHVQFKNNVGWGEVAHYKIGIDLTEPEPFEVQMDTTASDNPSPELRFNVIDSLSGFSHALIFIGEGEPYRAASTTVMIPPQKPGKKTAVIHAYDKAGNFTFGEISFEVYAIAAPTIGFHTKSITETERLFISGGAQYAGRIEITILDKNGQEVQLHEVDTDDLGNWEAVIDHDLPRGDYVVSALARDRRQAWSNPAEPVKFSVKAKVVLTIGFLEMGWLEIFMFFIMVIALIAAIIAFKYLEEEKRSTAYGIVAKRDLDKMLILIMKDVGMLEEWVANKKNKIPASPAAVANQTITNIKKTVKRMKKYLGAELAKIK